MVFHPERVAENRGTLSGCGLTALRSGGLRYAPTIGYYLTTLQAEDALAKFSHSLGKRVGRSIVTSIRFFDSPLIKDDFDVTTTAFGNPRTQVETRDADFARGRFGDLKVDVLLTTNPLFDDVRKRYTTMQRFVEQEIPCATVEGLILLKLYALPSLYRQGNFTRVGLYENDVATMLHAHNPPIEPLLAELSLYLSEDDMKQVEQIASEIQQRLSRFEERS